MSLVFAAITPHPPVLIPAIGKEHLARLEQTRLSLERLEQELYSSKPDLLLIISPHGELFAESFAINLSDAFEVNFELFGNFTDRLKFKGETVSFTTHKEAIAAKSPINIISVASLDHGIGVPLFYLTKHLPNLPIAPIYFSMLDNQTHYEFGKALKDAILNSDKRIAVVASGDLSHSLTSEAPAPYSPDGKKFDENLIKHLTNRDSLSLVNMDPKITDNAKECGLRSILIFSGILSDMQYRPEILSYESPFGVGYLTALMDLN